VQGVKTPCAFNKTGFSNSLSLKNLGSAGQKEFFDTLNRQGFSTALPVFRCSENVFFLCGQLTTKKKWI